MKNKPSSLPKIFISDKALDIMLSYQQKSSKAPESGGILLGQVKGDEIYIFRVTTPNSFDKQSRFSFTRDKKAAQLIIDHEFINSNNKTIYLGEWHTHPEANPSPSRKDLNMIKSQFSKSVINDNFVILIIIGLKDNFVSIVKNGELYKINDYSVYDGYYREAD